MEHANCRSVAAPVKGNVCRSISLRGLWLKPRYHLFALKRSRSISLRDGSMLSNHLSCPVGSLAQPADEGEQQTKQDEGNVKTLT